ncbi:MAG: hypoxanthine phosphoribosyltransferase [Halobacteriovoraceae bacterium]|nr:hypoxanthine phosphoribosyltransferase [Halobacteriovoraceae bacterium]|tara:strand:+ start:29412 stop:29942 length:531 start_codon:yes stop_codon:yes gene_type:complete
MEQFNPDVLISEDEISLRLDELAKAINQDFAGEEVVLICVLKGAFMFCSDLMKKISLPVKLEFMQLSSYGDKMSSSGNVKVMLDVTGSIKGKNVIVIEDIVDTGLTLKTLLEILKKRDPKAVKLASLLYKPARNTHPVDIDYLGFEIEDKFVIGYGLDYAGRYRELPYIGVINAGN